MAWTTKGTEGPPLSMLCFFYKQKMYVLLQTTHVASILRQVVTIKEGSSRLVVLSSLPRISLIDMLHATGGGFSIYCFLFLHVAHLFWVVCLPELWSFPFVFFYIPFLGAFFL